MRDNECTRSLVLVLAAAVTLTACGGKSADTTARTAPASSKPPSRAAAPKTDQRSYYPPGTHKASRAAVRVITSWSNELRKGHVRRAARYFEVPTIVQNATPAVRLDSKREVLAFNRTLPCGAQIVRTLAGGRYTVATFVLTERRGSPGCGATGQLAATAFLLHNGKIREWRRVTVPPTSDVDQGEGVPAT